MSRKVTDITRLNALFNLTRASVAPDDERYTPEPQTRLVLGPFHLVLATNATKPRAGSPAVWALPGGGRATTAQLLELARRNGWKRPAQIQVTVRRLIPGDTQQQTLKEKHDV